ncbi:MAG: GTP-binding protein, partial [Candidatus Kariarchaeaceae archaeon]
NENPPSGRSQLQTRFKTVLIGDDGVGKTSIKRSYMGLEFIDNYEMTLEAEASIKRFGRHDLQIWDLGGQRGFQKAFDDYFVSTDSAVIVFDISNQDSFNNISRWIELITLQHKQMIPSVIVGNKSDLRGRTGEEVSYEKAMEYSRYLSNNSVYEIPYIESSALTGLNISYIFENLISTLKIVHGIE